MFCLAMPPWPHASSCEALIRSTSSVGGFALMWGSHWCRPHRQRLRRQHAPPHRTAIRPPQPPLCSPWNPRCSTGTLDRSVRLRPVHRYRPRRRGPRCRRGIAGQRPATAAVHGYPVWLTQGPPVSLSGWLPAGGKRFPTSFDFQKMIFCVESCKMHN
jgi:hypothetical protein